jgi:hypothetical protein
MLCKILMLEVSLALPVVNHEVAKDVHDTLRYFCGGTIIAQ